MGPNYIFSFQSLLIDNILEEIKTSEIYIKKLVNKQPSAFCAAPDNSHATDRGTLCLVLGKHFPLHPCKTPNRWVLLPSAFIEVTSTIIL